MYREIKFRGKRIDNGEWVYGDLAHNYDSYIKDKSNLVDDLHQGWVKVDPATVGQFTGLHDKEGWDIYEGDILQADDPNDTLTFSVKWYDYGGTNLLGINTAAFLVIGNIYDNPELLESGVKP